MHLQKLDMKPKMRSAKHYFFLTIMITAFSWVIIGDLVSFHMELLYGDKYQNHHQPFTKTQKDDSRTLKVKEKTKDQSAKTGSFHLVATDPFHPKTFKKTGFVTRFFQKIQPEHLVLNLSPRAPPAIG